MHLLFVPDAQCPHWLLWGGEAGQSPLAVFGEPTSRVLPDETLKLRRVRGYRLPLLEGVVQLAAIEQTELPRLPASLAVWSLAAKLGLELVAREQLVPRVYKQEGVQVARWSVALNQSQDVRRVEQLAQSFPVAAHALPLLAPTTALVSDPDMQMWNAASLLREFLDTLADQLVRAAQPPVAKRKSRKPVVPTNVPSPQPWPRRWRDALIGVDAEFVPNGIAERSVLSELRDWVQPVLVPIQSLRLSLQLLLPALGETGFILRFSLQSIDKPELQVSAHNLFNQGEVAARQLQCELRVAQELLLQFLAIAARSFSFIETELRRSRPESLQLTPRLVHEFLQQVGALEQAGIAVQLPHELQVKQRQILRMQMCIGATMGRPDTQTQLNYYWRATLAGQILAATDIEHLLELRTPLARFNEQWVLLNQRELLHAEKLLAQNDAQGRAGGISLPLGLSLALTETITQPDSGLFIEVFAEGGLAELVAQMRAHDAINELPMPAGLTAELRHYQSRGMSWLVQLTQLGLGACLADDMGLGKTLQWLAYLLHRRALHVDDMRPVLLVCPTSVIGNWEREAARFAPTLPLLRHYGAARIQNADDFQLAATGQVVITSYGLLRRDLPWLQDIEFAVVALDEAQFIKNSASATARAARALRASERVALTGTPVENHLTELWSIMEFLNPGLLGKRETFRRVIAIPVERYGREDVALRLRRMVAPFILRRVKTDPTVISDLPDKQESKVFCSLTREQASLYQSAVDESFAEIETVDGITRRGRVLALLTVLKQICNHPAHYLREQGPLAGRSGKLDRLLEMLEQVLAEGDRALIFTQYREMGERLSRALARLQGKAVPFLHGGVSRVARDEIVRRFQEEPRASRLLVISLKAGGTGLNLTAATVVFHFDRWWNPAVEDQATDRAYRIGQQRNVQVYKMLCAGTVEEKIDQMLDAKRDLAARVVGQGEAWITELDNIELRELFALAPNAVVGDAPDIDEPEDLPARVGRRVAKQVDHE
ncbi:MAG: DEAD/DEAH box helicase [Steroidobacteraceae bacterium]